MEHQLHTSHTEHHHGHRTHDDFLMRFRQNLWKETKSALSWFFFIFYTLLGTLVYGISMWLFEFDEVKDFFKVLFPPLLVFCIAQYLTLIPTMLALVVVIASFSVPIKQIGKLLGVAIFISFFAVFLV